MSKQKIRLCISCNIKLIKLCQIYHILRSRRLKKYCPCQNCLVKTTCSIFCKERESTLFDPHLAWKSKSVTLVLNRTKKS